MQYLAYTVHVETDGSNSLYIVSPLIVAQLCPSFVSYDTYLLAKDHDILTYFVLILYLWKKRTIL